MTEAALTRSIKRALIDGLRENREAFRDLLAEVMEDIALAKAIREGEKTKRVSRTAVMKALARRK